jgi:carbamoyl-phosphate synthase small subunit
MEMPKGYLVLENGAVFEGEIFGKNVPIAGEAVFNTSMNGYQEIITDPSYAGQILTLTYPSIGNYGSGSYGFESDKPALRGLVVKEIAELTGHYESQWSFFEFLEKYDITCLTGVDTRAITRILRMNGTMGAIITTSLDQKEKLMEVARKGKGLLDTDLVKQVSCKQNEVYGSGATRIVLMDFGAKRNIINSLIARDCTVTAVPAETTAEEILAQNPDGLVLSNGPGNPESCGYAVQEIKKLLNVLPIFGICLGHQLLALALGGSTYKLGFGHRGGNHTVKDLRSGKCLISSQNHGYAVDAASLPEKDVEITFINLNDNTVEGIVHNQLPLMSVQFHPEAAPGPRDSAYLFDEFLKLVHVFQKN